MNPKDRNTYYEMKRSLGRQAEKERSLKMTKVAINIEF